MFEEHRHRSRQPPPRHTAITPRLPLLWVLLCYATGWGSGKTEFAHKNGTLQVRTAQEKSGLNSAILVPILPTVPADFASPPTHTLDRIQAVVRALKAKRGSRRRHSATTSSSDDGNSGKDSSEPKDDPASLARASADEAEAILAGLRGGLVLRDEVVAATEAGELHRGTCV